MEWKTETIELVEMAKAQMELWKEKHVSAYLLLNMILEELIEYRETGLSPSEIKRMVEKMPC